MYRKLLAGLTAAAAVAAMAGAVQATTYVGNQAIGGTSVQLSITTDGATGALAPSDITDFDIRMNDGSSVTELTQANANMVFYYGWNQGGGFDSDNGHLTATPTALSFLFTGDDNSGIFFEGPGLYCLQGNACADWNGPEIFANGAVQPMSGDVVIATVPGVGGVPEPATWAMLILGVAMIGLAVRRQPRGVALAA